MRVRAGAKDPEPVELVCYDCYQRGRHRVVGVAVREVRPDAPQFAPRDGGEGWYWWRPLRLHHWGEDARRNAAADAWADATYRSDIGTERAVFIEVADDPTERIAFECRSCRRTVKVRQARLDERCDAADGQPVAV